MDSPTKLELLAFAREEAEIKLTAYYRAQGSLTRWYWPPRPLGITTVRNRHHVKFLRAQYLCALYEELSARLSALPREIRDLIYEELWEPGWFWEPGDCWRLNWYGIEEILPVTLRYPWSPNCCSPATSPTFLCPCSTHLPYFIQVRLMDKVVVGEILDALNRRIRAHTRSCASTIREHKYRINWDTLERFATPDIFHLGVSIHRLFETLHLRVLFDCMDVIDGDGGLEVLGIPGGFKAQLDRCVKSLWALCEEKPRRVTFVFKAKRYPPRMPSNATFLFRALSAVFHELKARGFDVHVVYEDYWCRWELSVRHWAMEDEPDPWTWDLTAWNLNLTRSDLHFHPRRRGEHFPEPNGPIQGSVLEEMFRAQ
ncbi:hypothetical protein NX059_006770 [Plenodomus lindquistii]|nr:hypothetical protein NX059_006770 [Plenodomus lindquistii]